MSAVFRCAPKSPARWAVYEVCIFVFLFMGRFLGGGSFLYARY
mgnify:CR=1 FL=1